MCEGRPKTPTIVDLDQRELAFIYGHTRVMREGDSANIRPAEKEDEVIPPEEVTEDADEEPVEEGGGIEQDPHGAWGLFITELGIPPGFEYGPAR